MGLEQKLLQKHAYVFQKLRSLQNSMKRRRSQLCQVEAEHRQKACEDIKNLASSLEQELDAIGIGQDERNLLLGRDNEAYNDVCEHLRYMSLAIYSIPYVAEKLRTDAFKTHDERKHAANTLDLAAEYLQEVYRNIAYLDF
jgi:hypothetical protein